MPIAGVTLVKVDVDAEKFIAAQFRIQSIPTVYAFFQGQPVADLSSARTEGQLTGAIDQILAQLPVEGEAQQREAEIEPLIAMGEQVLGEGDAERAANIFAPDFRDGAGESRGRSPASPAPCSPPAAPRKREAKLENLPEKVEKDPAIARARSALALAELGTEGDPAAFQARIAANPDDLEARYELAGILAARGDRDAAADQLLESIARDREWNEGAARKRLLQLLEAVGLEDPWAGAQRRRLSAILFG